MVFRSIKNAELRNIESTNWGRLVRQAKLKARRAKHARRVEADKPKAQRYIFLGHETCYSERAFQPLRVNHRQAATGEITASRTKPIVRPEAFIRRADRLDQQGQTDAALDLIYDGIEALLRKGEFESLNSILNGLCIHDLSADLLLGVLTATLPARTRLMPVRARFFNEVEASLKRRDEFEDDLLTGLE